jgi:putative hemolysin
MDSRSASNRPAERHWPTGLDPSAKVPAPLRRSVRRALGLEQLMRLYRQLPTGLSAAQFARAALDVLGIRVEVAPESLRRIPDSGPVVFVANHPHGALDGLVTIASLAPVRSDLRVLANYELAAMPALAQLVLPLDPYGRRSAVGRNATTLRTALRWLRRGGAVLLFPAGQVARFDLRTGRSADPPWPPSIGRWLRLAGAPLVPLYISGGNGSLFHLLSLIHPGLGTMLLPRELLRARARSVKLKIAPAVAPGRMSVNGSDEEFAAQLRLRIELLARVTDEASENPAAGAPSAPAGPVPVPATSGRSRDPVAQHRAEIERLPGAALLAQSGSLRVYRAKAAQIPELLVEIGRLRERTFRAAGEGTGRDLDLDLFDNYYDQLILWDADASQVVGGYRIGRIDEIRRAYGARGLYTQTLFEYQQPLLRLLGPALELGRSFVRQEWQRSYTPLLTLWRGIGAYVAQEPRYCRLLGPVSISASYSALSRDVLVEWLSRSCFDPWLATLVRPRHRYPRSHALRALGPHCGALGDVEALSGLIADLESDGKGVPVLLRHYLRLGGRILGFNIDPEFSHSVDCLLLLDLRHTDRALLRRYMSPEGLARFEAAHVAKPRARYSA